MSALQEMLEATPYAAYLYSYPHKTAYRRLQPAVALDELWDAQDRSALFLYLHVPFCEMRCGFCNLFTTAKPKEDAVEAYLGALARQAKRVRAALGGASGRDAPRFVRAAIGGGTPTLLDASQLAGVLDLLEETMGADLARIPVSVEVSPETADGEKLALLRARGVDRVSIGVQSFLESETAAVYRPQKRRDVERVLGTMKELGFPTVNVDLIYGIEGQTPATWIASINAALTFEPEELYLYPLYVRPLTSLGKSSRSWDDERIALYRAGREHLLARGWTQVSMRMFRAPNAPDGAEAPVYHCQEDGMVGLGSGARSYTDALHYSTEFAVGQSGVRQIIDSFIATPDEGFGKADWGIRLDAQERRRRWVILSLLAEGVDLAAYRARFGGDAMADLPELGELAQRGLAELDGGAARLSLTAAGVERSDTIGPWLFSSRVQQLMRSAELR